MIVHIISSLSEGGAEVSLYRLCRHGQLGSQRVICLMDGGKYGPLLRDAGVHVDCLNQPRGSVGFLAFFFLWRLLRSYRPTIVQTWMYHSDLIGGLAARLAGVPRIVWGVRTSQLDASGVSLATQLVIRLCALAAKWLPDLIVCCAERAKQVHQEMGYPSTRMHVIANGYDFDVFKPDKPAGQKLRRQLGLSLTSPIIGMVARFDPQKDHRTLLEALALLRWKGQSLACLLIGVGLDGSNPVIKDWISEFGLNSQVHLLGSRQDIPQLMNAMTFHVLTSVCEAFPNVVAESMACGVPCIATDVGDSRAIIGESGWIVSPRDPHALASILETALSESEGSYLRRSSQARDRVVSHYSIDHMVERYFGLYHRISRS